MQTLPLNLDLFAFIILLGVAQAIFLGIFFLTGTRGQRVANQCLGWLLLALAAVIGEMFLCYSNYMFRLLALVDFSEPLNFVMGPLFFLFVFARTHRKMPRLWGWHFVPFGLWLINSISWLYQPTAVKYNNYLEAWYPKLSPAPEPPYYMTEDFFGIRDYINELTLISCLVYNVVALVVVIRAYRQAGQPFWTNAPGQLAGLRNLTLLFLAVPVLLALVKLNFKEDLGDYLLASYLTVVIYAISIRVMADSTYFSGQLADLSPPESSAEPRRKYEKSSLSEEVEAAILQKLTRLMDEQKPYLQPDVSLTKLAGLLNASPHHLSQLLNDRLNQSFFDLLATYRVQEARQLLNNPATAHLKIDEIAERVGYNSTSAFHTAFKRLTNQTPAQFRDAATSSRSA